MGLKSSKKSFSKKYGPFGSKGVDPFSAHRGLTKWDNKNAMKTRDALGWGDDGQTDRSRRAMMDALRGNRSGYNTAVTTRNQYGPAHPGYSRPPRNYIDPKTRQQFSRPIGGPPPGGGGPRGKRPPGMRMPPRYGGPGKPPPIANTQQMMAQVAALRGGMGG